MYKNRKISISIPAYNEEKHIVDTLKGIPDYVDYLVPVNDCSKDGTYKQILTVKDRRVHPIDSKVNGGVGDAILKAHNKGVELGADILVVMAGDNQMDPDYLPALLDAIIEDGADFSKGNRFFHRESLKKMPRFRFCVNIFFSLLIKVSSGYWSISDPLNGYTAIKRSIFEKIDQRTVAKRYDFEISMITALSMIDARVRDVFIPAVYKNERSTVGSLDGYFKTFMRAFKALLIGYMRRMFVKNLLYNLSPVLILLAASGIFYMIGIAVGTFMLYAKLWLDQSPSAGTSVFSAIMLILGTQFLLHSLLIDIEREP